MKETFKFNQEHFTKSLFINLAIQFLVFSVIVAIFAKSLEMLLIYAFVLGSMLVYMWNLNLEYNPVAVEFIGSDIKVLRKNFRFKEYTTVYDANSMIKTTISKRENKFHSVIFLHQFTENKVMPVKIHLKYIEESDKFAEFLFSHFRNMHEAEIKR